MIDVNGVQLAVDDTGSGPAVLLLHGFPDNRTLWHAQSAALVAAGYRVIAPDLRGFGESSRPLDVAAYRMPVLVADIVGLLDALSLPSAHVVGHDWGAGLAWSLALTEPARVDSLTALSVGHPYANAAGGLEQRRLSWYMLWFLFPGVAETRLPAEDWAFLREFGWGGVDGPDLRRQIADLSRPGALTAALNWYRANIDPAHYVPRRSAVSVPAALTVSCPTMGVWSTGDFALGEEQMTDSARFVSGDWRYERIDGAGHWLPVEVPDRITGLLLDFLP